MKTGRITFCDILWRLSKICPNIKYSCNSAPFHMEPTSAVCLLPFFTRQVLPLSLEKSNMYTDVVATVGVCGFLWHCLAPLASQQRCTCVNTSAKKGKQAETGFSIKNHSTVSSKFGGDKLIHEDSNDVFFVFFHLRVSTNSRVSEHKSLRFMAAFCQDSTILQFYSCLGLANHCSSTCLRVQGTSEHPDPHGY